MVKESKSQEKLCLFFASDYHFEMISLPYINENLKKGNNVIVMTESDLNESIDKLLSRINLKEEDKNKISKINWKKDDKSKLKEIEDVNSKKTVVFVKGKENYIECINNDIKRCKNFENIKIIDCYDVNEVYEDVDSIVKNYNKILSTSGVEKLL